MGSVRAGMRPYLRLVAAVRALVGDERLDGAHARVAALAHALDLQAGAAAMSGDVLE